MFIRISQTELTGIAGTIDDLELHSYLSKCSGTQLRKFLDMLEAATILGEAAAHKRFEWWADK